MAYLAFILILCPPRQVWIGLDMPMLLSQQLGQAQGMLDLQRQAPVCGLSILADRRRRQWQQGRRQGQCWQRRCPAVTVGRRRTCPGSFPDCSRARCESCPGWARYKHPTRSTSCNKNSGEGAASRAPRPGRASDGQPTLRRVVPEPASSAELAGRRTAATDLVYKAPSRTDLPDVAQPWREPQAEQPPPQSSR